MIQLKDNKLIIRKKGEIRFVNLEKILFFERFNHKTYLQLSNDKELILNSSLKELEGILPNNFKRTHRSFVINIEQLESLNFFNEKTYEALFPNNKHALVLKEFISSLIS
ncbi:LytTR family transcriptional regulator DNA-binding domain-containing protein [Bacillus velezensis]|uniref:LytTR family transcriptional regulator DNA-binding domain-containing protein n=1 Tax=Bacillus velezensis TaxID=492670 RepID=UPI0031371BE2